MHATLTTHTTSISREQQGEGKMLIATTTIKSKGIQANNRDQIIDIHVYVYILHAQSCHV